MAKVKVEVLDAVVDGKKKGTKLEIDEHSADHLVSIDYVRRIKDEPKLKPKQKKMKANDK